MMIWQKGRREFKRVFATASVHPKHWVWWVVDTNMHWPNKTISKQIISSISHHKWCCEYQQDIRLALKAYSSPTKIISSISKHHISSTSQVGRLFTKRTSIQLTHQKSLRHYLTREALPREDHYRWPCFPFPAIPELFLKADIRVFKIGVRVSNKEFRGDIWHDCCKPHNGVFFLNRLQLQLTDWQQTGNPYFGLRPQVLVLIKILLWF